MSADEVFNAYRADGNRVIARVVDAVPGETEREITVANASDRDEVLAALVSGDVSAMEDRFVVFLASVHPQRARFFQSPLREPITLNQFHETLPNRGARWVYRLRVADTAGRLSSDGLTVRAIVRVPSTSEIAAPVRVERSGPKLVVRVAGGSEVTDLIVFTRALPSRVAAHDAGQVLRVRSARGPVADRVRLRLDDGTLLAPSVKSLSDPDVVVDGPYRTVTVNFPANELLRVWACAATRDGILSPPGGPWRIQGGAS